MSDRKYRHETAWCNLSKSFFKHIRMAVNNYLTQGIPQQQGTWQIACLIPPATLFSKLKMSK